MSEPTQTNRKKSRRRNGDGNTYRHKNGWRTGISHKGHTVTAMGRSEQESRRLAKEKIKALPIYDGSLVPAAAKLTTGEYLTNWITKKHKTSIAATTYRQHLLCLLDQEVRCAPLRWRCGITFANSNLDIYG